MEYIIAKTKSFWADLIKLDWCLVGQKNVMLPVLSKNKKLHFFGWNHSKFPMNTLSSVRLALISTVSVYKLYKNSYQIRDDLGFLSILTYV